MKGARGDEQHMVGLHRAMFRRHGRALDQGQQVALHALARYVAAAAAPLARADLVHFVDEHDAVVLGIVDRLAHGLLLIDQLVALLGDKRRDGVLHMKLASLRAALKGLAKNVAKRKGSDAAGDIGHFEHRPARAGGGDFNFDLLVVKFAGAIFPAKAFPRRRLGGGTDQGVEHPVLGGELRARLDALAAAFLDEADRHLDEIAHDLLDVAADIADLGEFRGLDLQEGRVGEPRQPAGDLGLAAAGGADHQYVLWQNLLAHLAFET